MSEQKINPDTDRPNLFLLAARICHEVNASYCAAIGDDSQPTWDEAPEWQRESALKGVEFALNNPHATPAYCHESWLAQKVADGWKLGPVKDASLKEHPCMVPYEDLPLEQRVKDHLFMAAVRAVTGWLVDE